MAQGTGNGALVINMEPASNTAPTAAKENRAHESLFGPNIGVMSSGPAWTNIHDKKVLTDELTRDVVKGWIARSKEASQPTTTLQALVNLKRPTLRLSPLTASEEAAETSSSQHQHGLEFEYDCDAPKCGIYVHVLLPANHPDAAALPPASKTGHAKLAVFDTVTEGGFGRVLKLEEGAVLELGRFERCAQDSKPATDIQGTLSPAPEGAVQSPSTEAITSPTSGRARRRFTAFNFRKRGHNASVSGPALAVVDAEPTNANPTIDKKDDAAEGGVRVTIRLIALDENGNELASPNEQVTYLHVVRLGPSPPAPAATEEQKQEDREDTRPWVVKVVKREATIGPHTFHLHEIYGLTSSSTSAPPPTATIPPTPHTYPPSDAPALTVINQAAPQASEEADSAQSECLLCLSSPREVVLLPCRHLVACKECALNMVEFGAGGTINHTDEPPTATPGEETTEPVPATNGATTPTPAATEGTPPAVVPTAPRRKRKAKGWFCPVCRQPYASLLRITTTPPPPPGSKDQSQEDSPTEESPNSGEPETTQRTGGLLANAASALRPGFLRSISGRNNNNAQQGDLENQRPAPAA